MISHDAKRVKDHTTAAQARAGVAASFQPPVIVPTSTSESDPIILEFVFGMLLAIAYREGVRVPMLACIGLIVASFMLFFVLYRYVSADPALRAINWGLPAVLLVAGATLGGFSLASPWWRALAIIGNASYSLYLFHSFSIRAVISLAHRADLDLVKNTWPLLAIVVTLSITLALTIYYLFERPVAEVLRDRLIIARTPQNSART